ncbi:hypothetical protein LB507_007484 [Fusarium sp. FIESC RH6]|nr:hypothetical protein LB507_007484 [Fusarium sp. FIESC RH6]
MASRYYGTSALVTGAFSAKASHQAQISKATGYAHSGTNFNRRQRSPPKEEEVALKSLTAVEASTLISAPLTAWNALYGLESKAVRAGDWVLTQSTGGVILAAIQFAVAVGATVVATTSSNDRFDALNTIGSCHVINYREIPNWGEAARELTPKRPMSLLA